MAPNAPPLRRLAIWVAAATGGLALLAGCGLAANPQPPTLALPNPPKDLTATRVGDDVHLHWTMPKETTDKVVLKGDQRAHFCWMSEAPGVRKPVAAGKAGAVDKTAPPVPKVGPDSCKGVGDGTFAPDKPADFTAKMPGELVGGAPRPEAFFVELQNHAGKTAGPSNAAWVATGAAPPGVTGVRLEAQAGGMVLRWDTAAPQAAMVLRIHRNLVKEVGQPKPGGSKPNQTVGAPPPEEQVLEVDLDKADPGVALDHDAVLDHAWKYWLERVLKMEIDKHALEIEGPPSETVTVDAKDVFPPGVPDGLAAVADAQAKAIDLSWTPDSDADLAGYVVYRRDMTAGTGMERISGKALVVPPSFADTAAVAGHRYAYAVSAVDQDGNESARSGEVEEELPQ
ncbi:MAG: hypothetical protein WA476_11590 [Acidobacteriaceae bacterium]